MAFAKVSNIELLALVRRAMENVLLLIEMAHAEVKTGGQQNNATGEAAANSVSFDKKWSEHISVLNPWNGRRAKRRKTYAPESGKTAELKKELH